MKKLIPFFAILIASNAFATQHRWFLFAGQSNMEGAGMRSAPYPGGDNINWHGSSQATGPGYAFAIQFSAKNPSVIVDGIQCSSGGTSIDQWQRGQGAYADCIRRWHEMGEPGINGIFFMQGEMEGMSGDTVLASQWQTKFAQTVQTLRADLGSSQIPFLFAQIGPNPGSPGQNVYDAWAIVQAQQASVSIPRVTMIKTNDLGPYSDDWVHFGRDACSDIGNRFYKADYCEY